jgi:hypothetical protein
VTGPGLAAAYRSLCHAAGSHVTLRSREKTTYRPQVATTASVYSNIKITPEQIAWLLNQFEALQEHSGEAWTIEVGPGVTDVVSVADGTSDLPSMPRQILDGAAEWLGGPPQYRLTLMIGDSPGCRNLAWRIAEEFGRSWPAVWSNDNSAEPVAPLGTWWSR